MAKEINNVLESFYLGLNADAGPGCFLANIFEFLSKIALVEDDETTVRIFEMIDPVAINTHDMNNPILVGLPPSLCCISSKPNEPYLTILICPSRHSHANSFLQIFAQFRKILRL